MNGRINYQTGSNVRMGRYGFEVAVWLVSPTLWALLALELAHKIMAKPKRTAAIVKQIFLRIGTSPRTDFCLRRGCIGQRQFRITSPCWTVIYRIVR